MKKIYKIGLPIIYLVLLYFSYRNLLLDTEAFKEIVNQVDLNNVDFEKFKNVLVIIMMMFSVAILFIQVIITSIVNYFLLKLIVRKDKSLMDLRDHIAIQIKLLLVLFPKLMCLIAFGGLISTNIIEAIFSIISLVILCILYKKQIMREDNKKSVILFLIVQSIITISLLCIKF